VCGNIKLAQDRRNGQLQTFIETRGEGGLFLCSPTEGYSILQGDLFELPALSSEERDVLLEAAWKLNRVVPEYQVPPQHFPSTELRPGDDFNERGDVRAVLKKHGWSCVKTGENEYWRRPGKSDGWSATLRENVFFVFSANAVPFEQNRGYPPFAVYGLLEHSGDFAEAASRLRREGFGSKPAGVHVGKCTLSQHWLGVLWGRCFTIFFGRSKGMHRGGSANQHLLARPCKQRDG
jgi:hypothetical protein